MGGVLCSAVALASAIANSGTEEKQGNASMLFRALNYLRVNVKFYDQKC